MAFLYGLSAAVTFPLVDRFAPSFYSWPIVAQGLVFTTVTYVWEFGWAKTIYKLTGKWPWRYQYPFKFFEKFEMTKIINPGYAPFWFAFGFVLERVHLYVVPNAVQIFEMVIHHKPWQLH